MEETKPKDEVVKEKTKVEETPKKKGSAGKVIMIVLAVLLFIALLCGGVAWFGFKMAKDKVEETEKAWEDMSQDVTWETEEVEEDEEDMDSEGKEPKVDEKLLQRDLLSDRFPKDIPLSGGKIKESSFNEWTVNVTIITSSSVAEAYEWYEKALRETDWIITSKSRQDDMASISFDNGEEDRDELRKVDITIVDSIWGYTNIDIRERY